VDGVGRGGRLDVMASESGSARVIAVPHGVLARVRAAFASLTEAEQRVATAFEQHPAQLVYLPVEELAARIGVSTATVVRFCQALGYRGLRDLKLALAAETLVTPTLIHEAIAPDDSVAAIARKVLQSDLQAIADSMSVLDDVALERAVELLLNATRVEFYGVGSSIPVALDAHYRFLRIGLPATIVTDVHVQAVSAAQLPPGAVAFAISHTGRTRETLNALRKAREAGASCILLTSHARTPLGRYADVQLVTASRETAFRTEAVASRIAHLSLIDALYVAVGLRKADAQAQLAAADEIIAEHRLP
jgi:RpiR family transcriptional regulator, carbohydrate utilization regulator